MRRSGTFPIVLLLDCAGFRFLFVPVRQCVPPQLSAGHACKSTVCTIDSGSFSFRREIGSGRAQSR
jgi:hypothetical protein